MEQEQQGSVPGQQNNPPQTPPAPPTPPVPPAPQQAPNAGKSAPTGNDVEDNKIWAALSYISFISIVVLLAKKDSAFAQFHAKQATVLFVLSLILWLVPIIGWMINLIVWAFAIVGLIQAAMGKWFKIPVVSQVAEKLNF